MTNNDDFTTPFESVDHDAARAEFLRVGKLSGLKKGMKVYYDFGDSWVKCTLIRELAGAVWLARLDHPRDFVYKVCVSVNTFGGVAAE
jgi:hypothetical protein